MDEISFYRSFQHPNIVSCWSKVTSRCRSLTPLFLLHTLPQVAFLGYEISPVDDGDNCIRIFMEMVPGGNVAQLVQDYLGPLAPERQQLLCNYTKQILDGLAYLHQRNVVHRDIKVCGRHLVSLFFYHP